MGPWGVGATDEEPIAGREKARSRQVVYKPVKSTDPLLLGHLVCFAFFFPAAQSTPVQHQVLPQPHPVQPLHVLDGWSDPTGLRL